jgi:hypothetical protein
MDHIAVTKVDGYSFVRFSCASLLSFRNEMNVRFEHMRAGGTIPGAARKKRQNSITVMARRF